MHNFVGAGARSRVSIQFLNFISWSWLHEKGWLLWSGVCAGAGDKSVQLLPVPKNKIKNRFYTIFSSVCSSCPSACTSFLHVLGGEFSILLILFAIIMFAIIKCVCSYRICLAGWRNRDLWAIQCKSKYSQLRKGAENKVNTLVSKWPVWINQKKNRKPNLKIKIARQQKL